MTTLVSIPESTQIPQWQPATWEDYLGLIKDFCGLIWEMKELITPDLMNY